MSNTTIGEFVIKTKQSDLSPYPVYNGGISYTGKYEEYNNVGPKIVISARGANAGFVNLVNEKFWTGNSCYSVEILDKERFSIEYIFQYLKKNQWRFTAHQQAANIPSVSKQDVIQFTIEVPSFYEQIQIGEIFSNFDHLITLHQRKLCIYKRQLEI